MIPLSLYIFHYLDSRRLVLPFFREAKTWSRFSHAGMDYKVLEDELITLATNQVMEQGLNFIVYRKH